MIEAHGMADWESEGTVAKLRWLHLHFDWLIFNTAGKYDKRTQSDVRAKASFIFDLCPFFSHIPHNTAEESILWMSLTFHWAPEWFSHQGLSTLSLRGDLPCETVVRCKLLNSTNFRGHSHLTFNSSFKRICQSLTNMFKDHTRRPT